MLAGVILVLGIFFLFKVDDLIKALVSRKTENYSRFVSLPQENGKSKIYEIVGEYQGQYVLKERPDLRTALASQVTWLN